MHHTRSLAIKLASHIRQFRARGEGSAAVEFALVAAPFFMMLLAIFDIGLAFVANNMLDNATSGIARKIMLGQAKAEGWSASTFRTKICPEVVAMMTCDKLRIDVRNYSSFSATELSSPPDPDAGGTPQFNLGDTNAIMVVRIAYAWPSFVPSFGVGVGATSTGRVITSIATFRNEPF